MPARAFSAAALVLTWLGLMPSPSLAAEEPALRIEIEGNDRPHSRIIARGEGTETALGDFRPGELVVVGGKVADDLLRRVSRHRRAADLLRGQRDRAGAHRPLEGAALSSRPDSGPVRFWSFQSGSYEKRPDWVLPVRPGFAQRNYQGMNATDYGGGTPVSDVWRAIWGWRWGTH